MHIRMILIYNFNVLQMESQLFLSISHFSFLFLKEDSLDHLSDMEEVRKIYERGKSKRRKARATP